MKTTRTNGQTKSPGVSPRSASPRGVSVSGNVRENVRPASGWTFLTNHAHVLAVLDADPERVLREVAVEVGITERAVQRIIHDLEDEGFIQRERVGRNNRYRIVKDLPLRHPLESHRNIGELLDLIG